VSTIGHLFVASAASRYTLPRTPLRTLVAWTAVLLAISILPDIDLVLPKFGIPDTFTLGHRGATHSLLAALIVSALVTLVAWLTHFPPWRAALGALASIGTHSLLDTLSPGPGIAWLWPFSTQRLPTFPILPIAPVDHLFSRYGLSQLAAEAFVFLPFLLIALIPRRGEDPGTRP
jgi:inner membrane protein